MVRTEYYKIQSFVKAKQLQGGFLRFAATKFPRFVRQR